MELREISNLPTSCGVYLFKDKGNRVIYVGKAKNIKKRVSQYFRRYVASDKTQLLVSQIKKILILSAHLMKKKPCF